LPSAGLLFSRRHALLGIERDEWMNGMNRLRLRGGATARQRGKAAKVSNKPAARGAHRAFFCPSPRSPNSELWGRFLLQGAWLEAQRCRLGTRPKTEAPLPASCASNWARRSKSGAMMAQPSRAPPSRRRVVDDPLFLFFFFRDSPARESWIHARRSPNTLW